MKGDRNEEIRQNQPFCAFQTIALPTNQQTNGHDILWKCEDALKNAFVHVHDEIVNFRLFSGG